MTTRQIWDLCQQKREIDFLWKEVRSRSEFESWVKANQFVAYLRSILEFTISKLIDIRHQHGHVDEQKHASTRGKVLTPQDFDMMYTRLDELWQKIFLNNCCIPTTGIFDEYQFLKMRQCELLRKLKCLIVHVFKENNKENVCFRCML